MSYSLYLAVNNTEEVECGDMTYNMRPLLDFAFAEGREAYWVDVLAMPKTLGQLSSLLLAVTNRLVHMGLAGELSEWDSPNGWGTGEQVRDFVRGLLGATVSATRRHGADAEAEFWVC